jgi:hypothetical protein
MDAHYGVRVDLSRLPPMLEEPEDRSDQSMQRRLANHPSSSLKRRRRQQQSHRPEFDDSMPNLSFSDNDDDDDDGSSSRGSARRLTAEEERIFRDDEAVEVPATTAEELLDDEDIDEIKYRPTISPEMEMVENKLGVPDPPSMCYGCAWSRSSASVAFENYNVLVRQFSEKKNSSDLLELCQQISEQYEELVRKPQNMKRRLGDPEIIRWTPATIYAHFVWNHLDDYSIWKMNTLAEARAYKHHIFHYGSWVEGRNRRTGRMFKVPTEKGFNLWQKAVRAADALYKSKGPPGAGEYGASISDVTPLLNLSGKSMHIINPEAAYGLSVARGNDSAGHGSTVSGQATSHRLRTENMTTRRT